MASLPQVIDWGPTGDMPLSEPVMKKSKVPNDIIKTYELAYVDRRLYHWSLQKAIKKTHEIATQVCITKESKAVSSCAYMRRNVKLSHIDDLFLAYPSLHPKVSTQFVHYGGSAVVHILKYNDLSNYKVLDF